MINKNFDNYYVLINFRQQEPRYDIRNLIILENSFVKFFEILT